jgi:hypothetical protein
MVGIGLRLAPPGGLAGISKMNAFELRYGHYMRSTGLDANVITLLLKYK